MRKRRGLISRQDRRLRNRLPLLPLSKGRDGFLPEGRDSGSRRVGLMPPLCLKDGLRDVPLFSHCFLLVFFPPIPLFFPLMVCGLRYITFPFPCYLNTLSSSILAAFCPGMIVKEILVILPHRKD